MTGSQRKLAKKRGDNFERSTAKKVHGVVVGRSKAINQLVPINSELELTIAHNGALAQLEKDKSLLDKIERMK